MELYPLAIQAIIYLAITSNFINALKIAKKSFVEPEKNTFECTLSDIQNHCALNENNVECVREACNRCILLTAALNPFAKYCYWMTSCVCGIISDPTCLDLISSDCY
ncbi:unnamed protein product [Dracunculus medinensis]|uniref:Transmembrane protein n=1 Tax=Dracunculus medinensis TaxID=318479 RepID=A0A0N4UG86_DRAME|nr:unnamed protein product [Dracunculus medinensis]